MTDRALNISTCPLCDLDPTFAMKTTDGSRLTTQNLLSQNTVRACVAPTVMEVDGNKEPGLFIIFHKVEDPEFITGKDLKEEAAEQDSEPDVQPVNEDIDTTGSEDTDEDTEGAPEQPDDGGDDETEADHDLDALSDLERRVFEYVDRQDESAQQGEIAGALLDGGYAPSEVDSALDALAERGYLAEIDDAVFKVA